MAGGTIAAIRFFDFIQRNLPEALGDEFADSDGRTASLRNSLIDEEMRRAAISSLGEGADKATRRGNGIQTEQIQTQLQTKPNTSLNSPDNFTGQGA